MKDSLIESYMNCTIILDGRCECSNVIDFDCEPHRIRIMHDLNGLSIPSLRVDIDATLLVDFNCIEIM